MLLSPRRVVARAVVLTPVWAVVRTEVSAMTDMCEMVLALRRLAAHGLVTADTGPNARRRFGTTGHRPVVPLADSTGPPRLPTVRSTP